MAKQFTEVELQEMECSIINRINYLHKQQMNIEEFKQYYNITNKVVDSLSDEEFEGNYELLKKIEIKLNQFYIDVSPIEFDNAEFLRLKYLIRNLFAVLNLSEKLNPIIIERNRIGILDTFID